MGEHTDNMLDEVAFEVERGKIGELCLATRTADRVHTDPAAAREAGFEQPPATPTHTVVAGHHRDQRGFVAQLGLDIARVVVGSVTWRYMRALQAGDAVRGTRRVVSDERRTGRDGGQLRLVTLETDWVDATGETTVQQWETLIERGSA